MRMIFLKNRVAALILFLAVIADGSILMAQTEPAPANFKFRNIKCNFEDEYDSGQDWVITGQKESIVFAKTTKKNPESYSLVSYKLTHKGKASTPVSLLEDKGTIYDVTAVPLNDNPASPKPAASDVAGLIYVLYSSKTQSELGPEIVFAAAKFDYAGELVGNWSIIYQGPTSDSSYIRSARLAAAKSPQSIGVALSICFYRSSDTFLGYRESAVAFFETDFDGEMLGDYSIIPTPNKGEYQIARIYKPEWNGVRWFIPVAVTLFLKEEISGKTYAVRPTRNEVWLVTATGGPAMTESAGGTASDRKMRAYRIETNDEDLYFAYERLTLIPQVTAKTPNENPAKAKGNSFLLFILCFHELPINQVGLDYMSRDFSLYIVNDKGKPTGTVIKGDLPPWKHNMTYTIGDHIVFYGFWYSNALYVSREEGINAPPAKAGDYLYLSEGYAVGKDLTPGDYTDVNFEYEQQFNFFRIETSSGASEHLAQRFMNQNNMYGGLTALRVFNGRIRAVGDFIHMTEDDNSKPVFSIF